MLVWKMATVEVTNGLLELEVGGGTGNTALNVVVLTPADAPPAATSINFQPAGADVPDGYTADQRDRPGQAGEVLAGLAEHVAEQPALDVLHVAYAFV